MMELDSKSCTVSESDPTDSPDVSMGEPWSPIHSECGGPDEDAASTDHEGFIPYDEEEEHRDVYELDIMGGHVDAEVEALHHSLREHIASLTSSFIMNGIKITQVMHCLQRRIETTFVLTVSASRVICRVQRSMSCAASSATK
jgi:hypothetical protein